MSSVPDDFSVLETHSTTRVDAAFGSTLQAADVSAIPRLGYDDPLAILGTAPFPDEPWWKRISPSTIFVLLAGAIAVLFLLHELTVAKKPGFPIDEAWVDQVYARNFFQHIAFEFNPGERTAGPTAPLWTVALAIGLGIFHDPILAGKLLGAIFFFLTGYYTFRLLRSTEHDYPSALLGGILTVTTAQLAWAELSGLESTLSTALVMAGIWWYFASPPGWRRYLTGAIFALAALTRPETTLLFALLLFYQVWHNAREHRLGEMQEHYLQEALGSVAAFALVIGPMVLTNIAMSSAVVPETFYAGMSRESVVVLARHGRLSEILMRLAISWRSIGFTIRDLYAFANPLFLVTIPIALIARYRSKWYVRDAADRVFDLTVLMLVAFPYLRAVMLGVDDNFGEEARWMHFLVPLYIACGVISIRILIRAMHRRPYGTRTMLIGALCFTLGSGMLALFGLPHNDLFLSSAQAFLLFLLFLAVLGFTAMRSLGIPIFKPEQPERVTEAERLEMKYIGQQDDAELLLPRTAIVLIRCAIVISFAWNLAALPQAAMQFGSEVRTVHNVNLGMAKFIAATTAPSDVIATDAIGALGWFSDRRVIDVQGRLTNEPSYNARQLGNDRGLLKTLIDTKPKYYASFGDRYGAFIQNARSDGFFSPVTIITSNGASLYQLNYAALPALKAKWGLQ